MTIPETCQLSKSQVFFLLRPECSRLNTKVLQNFFTPERMQRCQIDPGHYKNIRIFSIDQTHRIKIELMSLQVR